LKAAAAEIIMGLFQESTIVGTGGADGFLEKCFRAFKDRQIAVAIENLGREIASCSLAAEKLGLLTSA
jgi:hypothetical protein